jgi:sulfur-carrier protein adenylyltransferase/sulfurtransferase
MPSKMRILFICRQRGLRISTATVSITLMWRQYGYGVGCDHSVSRPTTALPPFFVRTLPDPLILDKAHNPHFFIVFDDDVALELALVRSEASARLPRTPEAYQGLTAKSVGIVGVGSAGSKIASTLARMGMGEFFLVDHDIFFPENIERHVLDWNNIGDHKADGVGEMLSRMSSRIKVDVSRVHLTGQESTPTVSGVLRKLSQCDLLIDATANPRVFNLLSSVALASQKPLVTYGASL